MGCASSKSRATCWRRVKHAATRIKQAVLHRAPPPPASASASKPPPPSRLDLTRMDSMDAEEIAAAKAAGGEHAVGHGGGITCAMPVTEAPAAPPLAEVPPFARCRGRVQARPYDPAIEEERLQEVHSSLAVLPKTKAGLDSITELCAQLYKVPVSAINLIDQSRLLFASVSGSLAEGWGSGIGRAGTFCEALLLPQVHTLLCVPDTASDPRFNCLACVAEAPRVRFYAGTPLVSSHGHRLGSLCLFDLHPRRLSPDALNLLACLAEMAVRLLEEHKVEELEREQRQHRSGVHAAQLERDPSMLRQAVLLCDTSARRWPVLWCNKAAAELTGLREHQLQGSGLFEVFVPEGGPFTPTALQEAARQQQPFATRVAMPGTGRWAEAQFSPASKQLLDGTDTHPLVDVSAALQAAGAPSGADISPSFVFAFVKDD